MPISRTAARGGFTLVELIIGLTITAWLAGMGALLFHSAFTAVDHAKTRQVPLAQVRLGLERMHRELQTIQSNSPDHLTLSPSSEITFVDEENNTIRYWLNNNVLMRNSQPLAGYISALSFGYIKDDVRSQSNQAEQSFYITIDLTIDDGISERSLRATVYPRRFL